MAFLGIKAQQDTWDTTNAQEPKFAKEKMKATFRHYFKIGLIQIKNVNRSFSREGCAAGIAEMGYLAFSEALFMKGPNVSLKAGLAFA